MSIRRGIASEASIMDTAVASVTLVILNWPLMSVADVHRAYEERNGEISVIPRK